MEGSKDTLVLIKEAKRCTLQKEPELSQRESVGVNAEHTDQNPDSEGVRIECRGIGLTEKLSQFSLELEMLLVRLRPRRRLPEEKRSQRAEEEHQKELKRQVAHSLSCQK